MITAFAIVATLFVINLFVYASLNDRLENLENRERKALKQIGGIYEL